MRIIGYGMALLAFLALSAPAMAKTVTTGGTTNDRVVSTLAGPAPQASKKTAKNQHHKPKVKSPPPLHDPN